MPTQLQFRRGTTAQNNAFTGAAGEISVDETIDTIRVHDGTTAGGHEITQNAATQTLTNKTLTSPTISAPTITGNATGVNLTLSGDLTVNGTTTTVASTNTVISDNLIELNNGAASNANDSGIVIERGSTGDNAFMGWDESADKFIVGTTTATGASTGDLTITSGTLVAATFEGNLTGNVTGNVTGDVTGNADTATALSSAVTVALSGDVTGSATFTSAGDTATIAATIAADSVALGTDTTGNYVAAGATSGSGISGSVSSEGGTFTVTSNATSSNTANTIVFRDGSGNFTAGVVTATATAARYADLAERYTSDGDYGPGTVVVFGGDAEVTQSTQRLSKKVAGIVSTDPAFLMNCELDHLHSTAIALTGRVPCKVVGPVAKGDILVTSDIPGYAMVNNNPAPGTLVGKSLEDKHTDEPEYIEVVIGRT